MFPLLASDPVYRDPSQERSQSQPQLEDGSVCCQLRPTRLDKIKNFYAEVLAAGVDYAAKCACRPMRYRIDGL